MIKESEMNATYVAMRVADLLMSCIVVIYREKEILQYLDYS